MSKLAPGEQGKHFQAIYPGVSQVVAFDASVQSSALKAKTTLVRLISTEDCFVAFGANPTAVADTCMFLKAGIPEYVGVLGSSKIAAIKASAAGDLYITEGA